MSLLDSFSGENAEGLAQLRLNVYTELKILPSAAMEEAWARTRAESGTNVTCTNCIAGGLECKPLATKLCCSYCDTRERVAKIGRRCSFQDDELYDRVAKLYTRSIHREAFDQALHDISGEKIDTEVLYTGWVTSGDLLNAAVVRFKKGRTSKVEKQLRLRVKTLEEENQHLKLAARDTQANTANKRVKELASENDRLRIRNAKLNNVAKVNDSWKEKYQIAVSDHHKENMLRFIHSSRQHHILAKALEENSDENLRQAVRTSLDEIAADSNRFHPGEMTNEQIETVFSSMGTKAPSIK